MNFGRKIADGPPSDVQWSKSDPEWRFEKASKTYTGYRAGIWQRQPSESSLLVFP